jgi:hypothetical protein
MQTYIPLSKVKLVTIGSLAPGTAFCVAHNRLPQQVGIRVDTGNAEAAGFVLLSSNEPLQLKILHGDDRNFGCVPLPIDDLHVRLGVEQPEINDDLRLGNLFINDQGASVLATKLDPGGVANTNVFVSLTDWLTSLDRPDDAAVFTNWELVAGTGEGARVVMRFDPNQ